MISQDIRTLYVDSNWCNVDPDGSFRQDMFDTMEVKEGNVAYVDDITIQGSMPHVSTANNKLYVIERTPYQWDFAGTVSTSAGALTVIKNTDGNSATYEYKCDMGANGILHFQPDDERLHWEGLVGTQQVRATYDYLTGKATWTAKMPDAVNVWDYGSEGANFNLKYKYTPRLLELPVGSYTSASMRTTLEYVLNNGRHFGGSTAHESDPDLVSGSQYVVTNSGDSISISVSPSTTNLDRFAILPEAYLSKQAALTYWLSIGGPRYALNQTRSVNKLLGNMGEFDGVTMEWVTLILVGSIQA